MQKPERQAMFRRNINLENLLQEINGMLAATEKHIIMDLNFSMPKYPVVFVVGAPRCGSTVMMQWLAQSGYFAYPTNLLSRFYGAPYVGAKIQLLLTAPEYNFNNEIVDFSSHISFSSTLGKTRGALEPNEFWYFWRRFIPNEQPQYLEPSQLAEVDARGFAAELAALEAAFGKPFATKGHILEYNIPFLSSILDKALFILVERHPLYNIQSLLEARVKYYGDRSVWYSVRPKEYEMLKDLAPIAQVTGQVYFTNKAIREGLQQIAPARGLMVAYEHFCESPQQVFESIGDKYAQQGNIMDWEYRGPARFSSTNQVRLPREDVTEIQRAYERFSGKELSIC